MFPENPTKKKGEKKDLPGDLGNNSELKDKTSFGTIITKRSTSLSVFGVCHMTTQGTALTMLHVIVKSVLNARRPLQ